MVVETLKLGKYKGLDIFVSPQKVDEKLVNDKIKELVTTKIQELQQLGIEENPFLLLDDQTVIGLRIEGIETLDDLKVHVRKGMYNELLINTTMRQVLDNAVVTYDEAAVDVEVNKMMDYLRAEADKNGFTIAFYCDYNNIENEEVLIKLYREEVYTSYLEIAVINEIAKMEGIQISSSMYEDEKTRCFTVYEEIDLFNETDFYQSLLIRETVYWLVEQNMKRS